MRLAGVIFDLDGTLGDTLPVCYAAFRLAFQRHLGRTFTNQEIHSRFGPSEEGVIRALAADRADVCYRDYLEIYEREHRRCARPFPGVVALLDELRAAGTRMAVVTGKGPLSAEISLRVMGLAGYFEIVEAGSAQGAVKPEAMRRTLETWGLPPDQVASVGDAPSDVRSARQVGVQAAAAAWAPNTPVERLRAEDPAVLCWSVDELRDWLR